MTYILWLSFCLIKTFPFWVHCISLNCYSDCFSAVSVRSKVSAESVAFRSHLFTNLTSPDFLDCIHNLQGIVQQIGHLNAHFIKSITVAVARIKQN